MRQKPAIKQPNRPDMVMDIPKGVMFHDEVEPIDMWDDILDDGKTKHRTVLDAIEEYKRMKEEGKS